ncbi:MAG: ribosome recycling factor [Actinobacteria bacterium]|nr:MAG: ribosome recycling factor [Actinomycetota bacterium]
MDSQAVISRTEEKMSKAVLHTVEELKGVRTGRASTTLLDRVVVDYYGTKTPLKQMATINVPEPQLITIQPWDKSVIPSVEKAIMASDLGLNPSNDGNLIRLSFPPLTEERRIELTKVVKHIGEEGKVAVRNVRRDSIEELKKLQKDGAISEDDYYREHDHIQKITDENSNKIDEMVASKEKEVMEV